MCSAVYTYFVNYSWLATFGFLGHCFCCSSVKCQVPWFKILYVYRNLLIPDIVVQIHFIPHKRWVVWAMAFVTAMRSWLMLLSGREKCSRFHWTPTWNGKLMGRLNTTLKQNPRNEFASYNHFWEQQTLPLCHLFPSYLPVTIMCSALKNMAQNAAYLDCSWNVGVLAMPCLL